MTLVRKIDGGWQPVRGVVTLERLISTRTVHYADGRNEEEACEPYPVPFQLDLGKVERLVHDGTWGEEELAAYGLARPAPFSVPEGKQRVGEPSFVEIDGAVAEVYAVEDLPPPPPPPTPAEKLASAGLTVEDLRALLTDE